ncbi:hypothetical protein ACFVQ4_21845 [Streptomyces laurentii]|uniref:hypothetical protein n=1 Tax=Streptomyces laurentii TaxID=39478 RepID=UPI0036B31775
MNAESIRLEINTAPVGPLRVPAPARTPAIEAGTAFTSPGRAPLEELTRTPGVEWLVEECFQTAKKK